MPVEGSVAVGSGKVFYVASQDGSLYALGPGGTKQWSYSTTSLLRGSPAIGRDGTIYISGNDGMVYAVTSAGKLRWSQKLPDSVVTDAIIGPDGVAYFGCVDNHLYALDGASGDVRWSFPTGSSVWSGPALGRDDTIYFGSNDGSLYALDSAGNKRWSFSAGLPVFASPVVGPDGTVYLGTHDTMGNGNVVIALDGSGGEKWRYSTGTPVPGLALGSSGALYVATGLHVAKLVQGQERWSFVANGAIYSAPTLDSLENVFFGAYDGAVYALRSDGTTLWPSLRVARAIGGSPSIADDGNVLVGAYANPDGGADGSVIGAVIAVGY
jgi:outer membrane protein assembly factor BamB